MKHIIFAGNCQMFTLSNVYRNFISSTTGDIVEYVDVHLAVPAEVMDATPTYDRSGGCFDIAGHRYQGLARCQRIRYCCRNSAGAGGGRWTFLAVCRSASSQKLIDGVSALRRGA